VRFLHRAVNVFFNLRKSWHDAKDPSFQGEHHGLQNCSRPVQWLRRLRIGMP
jgi:hypothetical protein